MKNLNGYLPQSVQGKNILITGGTTGIGRATAILLGAMGANVMIAGETATHLDEAMEDITKEAKGNAFGLVVNLAEEDGVRKLFTHTDLNFDRLDILINNAALGYGSITEGKYADWERIINTNLLSYLACCNEAIARMTKHGGGHIVNIGSMSADVREETSSVYVATKSGIQGFSEALRKQVNKDGIKVTLIEPGAVDTDMQEQPQQEKRDMVQKGTMLTAGDIAAAVLYCLSQPERCDVVDLKIRPRLQLI